MAYTNTWSDTSPTGSTQAKQIDDEFRKFRVDVRERMNSFVEDWTADPVVLKSSTGGPVTGKSIHVPGLAFISDNDISTTATGRATAIDSDLYAPVIFPIGATIKSFQAMVIPGLGTMTIRLGYITHGLSTPTFITVDSNTQVGSTGIKLVNNSNAELAHVVAVNRYYTLWITTDSDLSSPSKVFGMQIVYDIDNVSQTL